LFEVAHLRIERALKTRAAGAAFNAGRWQLAKSPTLEGRFLGEYR
jgi:hypothetical protein